MEYHNKRRTEIIILREVFLIKIDVFISLYDHNRLCIYDCISSLNIFTILFFLFHLIIYIKTALYV